MTKIKITKVTDLYLRLPRKNKEQPCFVSLDCETWELSAAASTFIESGVSGRAFDGHEQQWTIPCLKASVANALLLEIKPLAKIVVKGYRSHFDGNNHVGRFDEKAREAIEDIRALCEKRDSEDDRESVWDAPDWYLSAWSSLALQAKELGITGDTTDEQLDSIAEREEETATHNGQRVYGIRQHLNKVREAAGE